MQKQRFFFIITSFLLFFNIGLVAQSRIDSLESELYKKIAENKIDTSLLNIYQNLAESFQTSRPDIAIDYAIKGLNIASQIENIKYQAFFYTLVGNIRYNQKIYYLALDAYQKSITINESIKDSLNYAYNLIHIANTYFADGNFDLSISYYKTTLEIFEKLRNYDGLATANEKLGLTFSKQEKFTEAFNYASKALTIRQQAKQTKETAKTYFLIAQIYQQQAKYFDALNCYDDALIICNQFQYNDLICDILFQKGQIYKDKKQIDDAQANYFSAFNCYQSEFNMMNQAVVCNEISRTFLIQKKLNLALKYVQTALEISNKEKILEPKMESYLILSEIFNDLGEYTKSYNYVKLYTYVKDTIINRKTNEKYTELKVSIETKIQEKENEVLRKEKDIQLHKNKQQKLYIYLSIFLIAILCLITLLILNRYRHRKNSEKRLKQLTDATFEGLIIYDDGQILEVNKKITEITGFQRDDFIGRKIYDFLDDDSRKKINNIIETDEIFFCKVLHLRADGTYISADLLLRPFVYKGKKVRVAAIRDLTEHEKATKKLKESEILFSTLIETSPDGVAIIDMNGNIKYASPTFAQMFGYETIDNVVSKKFIDFIVPDYQRKVEIDLINVKKGSYSGVSEYCAIHKTEKHFYIECNSEIIKDAEGVPIGIFNIARDISDRKIIENALIESESRFRNLFDNAKDAILIEDDNENIIDANPFATKLFGYDYHELVSMKKSELISGLNKQVSELYLQNHIPFEMPAIHKSGKSMYIELSIATLNLKSAEYKLSVIRDITDKKSYHEEIKKREEKYRKLAELLPATVFEIDPDGNFLFLNKHSFCMFGYNDNESVTSIFQLIAPPEHALLRECMQKIIRETIVTGNEYKAQRKDGSFFPVIIYSSVLYRDNFPIGYNGIIIDNTDRKKFEEKLTKTASQLTKSNATKDRMFSLIAHDLRGPIGNFKSVLEYLTQYPEDFSSDDLKELLINLKNSASSTFDLLENLLYWARSQRGEIEYNPIKQYIPEIIQDTIELLQPLALAKEQTIFFDSPANIQATFDANMIKTVLRNLISNAIKFTQEKGKITIRLDQNQSDIIVSVTDTGIGISEENIEKIFKYDQYFTTTGTGNEKGSGLGLIVCKEFIERNKGVISVESTPNSGSTFRFTLPL